jgi:hypothetical protein
VFLVACAGFGAWEVIKARANKGSGGTGPESKGVAGERPGAAPHPHAKIIDLPGGAMRIIDLRSLPLEDLRAARLGVVQEQLLLERPVPVQIWVGDIPDRG